MPRFRDRQQGGLRCRPDLWRQRLQYRVPCREIDARRQDLPNLRGHFPNPKAYHIEGDLNRRSAEELNFVISDLLYPI